MKNDDTLEIQVPGFWAVLPEEPTSSKFEYELEFVKFSRSKGRFWDRLDKGWEPHLMTESHNGLTFVWKRRRGWRPS